MSVYGLFRISRIISVNVIRTAMLVFLPVIRQIVAAYTNLTN